MWTKVKNRMQAQKLENGELANICFFESESRPFKGVHDIAFEKF